MKIADQFTGKIVLPTSHGYDQARSMYNSAISEYPEGIYFCESSADVAMVVRAANSAGIQVAVRSTGHSVSGRSIGSNVAVLDLSSMRAVRREGCGRTLVASGGATWLDFDRFAGRLGLAVPGGTVSSTGVGGLTLGGGIGWLLPGQGLSCDSLTGVYVIAANGAGRWVRDESDAELMRCFRGLGHGLCVATALEFEAAPLGDIVGGSVWMDAGELSNAFIDRLCGLFSAPSPRLMLSPSLIKRDGKPILSLDLALHNPSASELEGIERMVGTEPILRNTVRKRNYVELQSMLDTPSRAGMRARWKSNYLVQVDPKLLRILIENFALTPSAASILFLEHYHAQYTTPSRASIFPSRAARYGLLVAASWHSAADDLRNFGWLDDVQREIEPWLTSETGYLNYLSQDSGVADDSWQHYEALKRQIDPSGVFVSARPPSSV